MTRPVPLPHRRPERTATASAASLLGRIVTVAVLVGAALTDRFLSPADATTPAPAVPAARVVAWAGMASTVLVLLVAVTAVAVGLFLHTGVGVQRRLRMGLNPEARFARVWDLAPLWVSGPVVGRLTLGRVGGPWRGRLVATEDSRLGLDPSVPSLLRRWAERRRGPRGAVLVVGPSQCGKTAALAIPAILEWAGPVVALSVKNDLMAATIARRHRLGEVLVFDPANATDQPGASWSPLREAANLAGARRAARSIANATTWTSGSSSDMGFWTSAAEGLLALLFWTAAVCEVGMDTVVGWVQTMSKDGVRTLLAPLAAHHDPSIATDGTLVLAGFDGLWRNDPKQVSSTYLVARQMIQPWQEPDVAASAANPRIDLDWLLGDRTRSPGGVQPAAANTLYLCADLDEAERLAPVLGGLLDDLMKQAYARVGRTDVPLDPPLLVVIDEAGNWPMRNLPGRISTCAGLGIQLMLVFQSKAQIDAAYTTKADIVVSNAITKVFFAGLSDKSTLDYAAGLLGQEHAVQRSTSDDAGGLGGAAIGGGRHNVSHAPTRLELLPAPLLRQIAPGQALLVHNTLPPAHLHGRYWYLDPDLHALATGRRMERRELARRAARRRVRADDRHDEHNTVPSENNWPITTPDATSHVTSDVGDATETGGDADPLTWPGSDGGSGLPW
ncbi:type IV secretory system conjugative DNA transfer family protein [Frankia sp. Cj3]|uniref:type IV secretory system conjugative DNA transfer family protein n=1 Tax=Frankia sp. Cj3 TaxID=2880976 RepID=UPI001EF60651|nr:type IV secretory system conjugative DNA transfer family protein [Frankia sp. Cj3]